MMLVPRDEEDFEGRQDLGLVTQQIGRDGFVNLDLIKVKTSSNEGLGIPSVETKLKLLARLAGDGSGGRPRWPSAGDMKTEATWDIGCQEGNLLAKAFIAHCDLDPRWRLKNDRPGLDLMAYWEPLLDSDEREKYGQSASVFGRSHTGDPRQRLALKMWSQQDLNEFVNGLIYQTSYLVVAPELVGR